MSRIPHDFRPSTPDELAACLRDPMWRLCSGFLYKIIVKSDETADGNSVIEFRPNRAQRRLIEALWHRNIILKARQLGFTTLVAIMWLDHALFNENQRCGMVAQDRETAESIFRDKIKFAYENLPEQLREAMPLARDSASELLFAHNNSSIRVATSMRGGTIHRLHVSEFGKICAKAPDKAQEVVRGSLPAVPLDGIAIIESTAEGQSGKFYEMTKIAMADAESSKDISQRDYKFHFFPWHDEAGYEMDSAGVIITAKDHEYFDEIEGKVGKKLSLRQRAWYCATRKADFADEQDAMWQEYPSTPEEAFKVSTEGTYYAKQLSIARSQGRIGVVPLVSHVPVNSFWDLGLNDETSIWLHQKIGNQHNFIGFFEASGEPPAFYVKWLEDWAAKRQVVWGKHYMPHDAAARRPQEYTLKSFADMFAELGLRNIEIVPRIDDVVHGINMVRSKFSQAWFDETECKDGLAHLALYRKDWNKRLEVWSDRPREDGHDHAADAFRQWAQGWADYQPRQNRKRVSAMAA